MFGLLNIDKPGGMTSRDVVNRVARLVKPHKVGHAGTLDPLATGVLVVCVGRATRLVPWVQEQRKVYRAGFRLGCTSDTDDVTGTVEKIHNAPEVTREMLLATLPQFIGRIQQTPPQFSAVKVNGRRAYDRARQGKRTELQPRAVHVHRIELLDFADAQLTLEIECGSGTYIRAIGRDLGVALGSGAVMTHLRRTRIGVFHEDTAIPLDSLDRKNVADKLLPAVMALAGRPTVRVSADDVARLKQGRQVTLSAAAEAVFGDKTQAGKPLVGVVDATGDLIAVAHLIDGRLAPKQVYVD